MRKDWVERFNQCDEVWATSDWCAEVFKQNGVTRPIYVYPHGIEEKWSPVKRSYNEDEVFKFLHVGEPSPRKSGQLVVDTFIKMFGNNPKYQLTLKCHHNHTVRVYDKNGELKLPEDVYSNIKVIKDEMSIDDLVALHQRHHVLIYPSWGEGFGFIPLQALATGMPVISTYHWAHYKKFIGPLKLRSTLTSETLPKAVGDAHVGQMFKPDEKHLEELMYDSILNFKAYSGYYFAQSTKIHEEYNWIQLTNKTLTSPVLSGTPVITGLSSAGMVASSATPKDYVDAILGSATAAATSAASAATSAASAATSATSASNSATASATSASAAATSATSAATSATSAAASATAAATSATSKAVTPIFSPMGLEPENWPATVGIFLGSKIVLF